MSNRPHYNNLYHKLYPGVKIILKAIPEEDLKEEEVKLIDIEDNGMLLVEPWGWVWKPGLPPNEMFEVDQDQIKEVCK